MVQQNGTALNLSNPWVGATDAVYLSNWGFICLFLRWENTFIATICSGKSRSEKFK